MSDFQVFSASGLPLSQVRGEDQLLSFEQVVTKAVSATISGANGYVDTPAVPAGKVWKITTICARDDDTAPTAMRMTNYHDGTAYMVESIRDGHGIGLWRCWSGETWLDASDLIRVWFVGGAVSDNCRIEITGLQMTKET